MCYDKSVEDIKGDALKTFEKQRFGVGFRPLFCHQAVKKKTSAWCTILSREGVKYAADQ
jgi:hypothetical protein